MTIKDIDFNKDYYVILGIPRDANKSSIKKAYRKLSLKYHPDRQNDNDEEQKKKAADKFVEINEAYSILSDEKLKAAYDKGPQDVFYTEFDVNDNDQPKKGEQVIVRLHVKYKDICNGIKNKKVKYNRLVRCKKCHGKGGENVTVCPHCHGKGVIVKTQQSFGMYMRQEMTCPHCHGKGKNVGTICDECYGKGLVKETAEYDVTLNTEHLINNGMGIFAGYYGSESPDENGINGELIFEIVHDLPDNIRIIPNNNSVVEKRELEYYDMMLGTDVIVNTPHNKKIKIKIPECSKNGDILKARGQGFNINGFTGDYIIVIETKEKKKLLNKEKEYLNKIRELHTSKKNKKS